MAPRTVARWEEGIHPVDGVCERIVRILERKADLDERQRGE